MLNCNHNWLTWVALLVAGLLGAQAVAAAETGVWDGKLVQYGKMHQAIGQQKHEGRVRLSQVVERPHFYGVAALERLAGEATIVDGKATVTRVNSDGQAEPVAKSPLDTSATLLVGAYVPAWKEQTLNKLVEPGELDDYLAKTAAGAGVNVSEPFVFTIEGEFSNVHLHVINGACPLHARLKEIELPSEKQPFDARLDRIRGTVVGVFARDAVGNITHPATATHMHLVFQDARTGSLLTGHIEQLGVLPGATLRLPRMK